MAVLRRLVAGLSPRRPGFVSGSVHMGFVVDKVALGQVFPRVLPFSLSFSFHRCSITSSSQGCTISLKAVRSICCEKKKNSMHAETPVCWASVHVYTPACRLGNIPASCSGGFAFKSQPRNRKLWEYFHDIPRSLQRNVVFVTQISLSRLPSTYLLIHYSIIILTNIWSYTV
jgi:hypothetical protein